MHSEGLNYSAPLLSDGHLMSLQVLVLVVFPVEQYLFLLLSVCEVDQFSLQNDDSVLLLFGYFGNEVVDVFEHLAVELCSEFLRSVDIDGSVHEVELLLEYSV